MKILLVDDHPIARNGLRNLLSQLQDIELIEEAKDAKEAFEKLKLHKFDVVVLDLSLPDMNGLDVLGQIKIKYPATHVLILSMHPPEKYAVTAINAGALSYLDKKADTAELIYAIRRVANGNDYITPEVGSLFARIAKGDTTLARHLSLSDLEFKVMIRFGNGKSLKEISHETAHNYKVISAALHDMMEKMEFKKKSDITPYCLKNKLLD
jgi:two-component system invasion response regulator UvrY